MERSLYLIFNHKLTQVQREDAFSSLGVDRVVEMPPDLKRLWSEVPAHLRSIREYLYPVKQWLKWVARQGDYVLIQGDFGATYIMVNFAFQNGLIPVYSTTAREAVEEHIDEGSVKLEHVFRHCRFRKYERSV